MSTTTKPAPEQIAAPILEAVSIATGVKVETLLGKSTDHPATKARQTTMVLLYMLTSVGVHCIGSIFRRDHAAVYYALNRVAGRASTDPGYRRQLDQLLGQREILRPLPAPVARCRKPKIAPQSEPLTGLSASTHGRLDQLNDRAAEAKLKDAREQLAYWTMKKASSFTESDRNQAAARILIWTGEVAACERRLRELNRAESLPV